MSSLPFILNWLLLHPHNDEVAFEKVHGFTEMAALARAFLNLQLNSPYESIRVKVRIVHSSKCICCTSETQVSNIQESPLEAVLALISRNGSFDFCNVDSYVDVTINPKMKQTEEWVRKKPRMLFSF